MIVTIDGPAGAGKSTVAKELARRLGFGYLDTGAMYRAVALAGLRRGVDWDKPEQLAELARQVRIELIGERVLLDGDDVTEEIRRSPVTAVTRHAAGNAQVRLHLVELQRMAGKRQSIVTEGRDQGTVVFPAAECKIFLTASSQERARRRVGDFETQGETAEFERVLADINRRDHEDSTREIGPMAAASDAIVVSTDGMTIDHVVDRLEIIVAGCEASTHIAQSKGRPAETE